jgi:hypothetical protein
VNRGMRQPPVSTPADTLTRSTWLPTKYSARRKRSLSGLTPAAYAKRLAQNGRYNAFKTPNRTATQSGDISPANWETHAPTGSGSESRATGSSFGIWLVLPVP